MIKIISQDQKSVFDLERINFFVCGNKLLISDKVNIYESKAACLGTYNDEQEAQDILMKLLETFASVTNIDNTFYCAKIPAKREIEEKENNMKEGALTDGREQGEIGENN